MIEYALVRILGNELPPRDKTGNRLQSLRFILENEPNFENCVKFWVLNTIHNSNFKSDLIDLLEKNNQEYVDFKFDYKSYFKSTTLDEKIRWAINVNAARNYGLDLFIDKAKFIFLFDGDCFFTNSLWTDTVSDIESDNKSKKYYGVPGVRIVDEIPADYHDLRSWEPSIVFRNDADLRFDESIPFSKNDRIDLLRRLGYICQDGRTSLTGSMCKNVGKLLHISFGDRELEENMSSRITARKESIDRLLLQISSVRMI